MDGREIYNDAVLRGRLSRIRMVVEQYGDENFSVSFSGGKDSTVLSELVDMALPGNDIPRVYADTGIELNMVRDFVRKKQETDKRIVIIKPKVPIKKTLETEGYPFKSKFHSEVLDKSQREGRESLWVKRYLQEAPAKTGKFVTGDHSCPDILKFQFYPGYQLRVSDKCCLRLKEEPIRNWARENNRPIQIVGIMRSEGGAETECRVSRIQEGETQTIPSACESGQGMGGLVHREIPDRTLRHLQTSLQFQTDWLQGLSICSGPSRPVRPVETILPGGVSPM